MHNINYTVDWLAMYLSRFLVSAFHAKTKLSLRYCQKGCSFFLNSHYCTACVALLFVLLKRCHHSYIQSYPWFLAWQALYKSIYKIFQVAERQMMFYCVPLPPKWTFQVYLFYFICFKFTCIFFLSFLVHSYRYMSIVFYITDHYISYWFLPFLLLCSMWIIW